jgi:hypothetical protein
MFRVSIKSINNLIFSMKNIVQVTTKQILSKKNGRKRCLIIKFSLKLYLMT